MSISKDIGVGDRIEVTGPWPDYADQPAWVTTVEVLSVWRYPPGHISVPGWPHTAWARVVGRAPSPTPSLGQVAMGDAPRGPRVGTLLVWREACTPCVGVGDWRQNSDGEHVIPVANPDEAAWRAALERSRHDAATAPARRRAAMSATRVAWVVPLAHCLRWFCHGVVPLDNRVLADRIPVLTIGYDPDGNLYPWDTAGQDADLYGDVLKVCRTEAEARAFVAALSAARWPDDGDGRTAQARRMAVDTLLH